MDLIKTEIEFAKTGGVWNDKDIEESLDWQGETGSAAAADQKDVTHTPKSRSTVEQEILSASHIDSDALAVVTARVERALLRSSGSANQTIIQMIDTKLAAHKQQVQDWIDAHSAKLSDIENRTKDSQKPQIDKLDERIASMELKIDSLIGSITKHGPEEARMIQEAYRVIMDRKAIDDNTGSDPSIFDRMDKRVAQLDESLRRLEPFVDDGFKAEETKAIVSHNVRKKFGRMM